MSTLLLDETVLEGIREDKARKNLLEAERLIKLDIQGLTGLLKKYYPLAILERVANEQLKVIDNEQSPSKVLMPYLLQSLLQTQSMRIDTGFSTNVDIKEADYQRIKNYCEDFTRRVFRYIDMYALLSVKEGKLPPSLLISYRDTLVKQIFPSTMSESEIKATKRILIAFLRLFSKSAEAIFGVSSEVLQQELTTLIDKSGKSSEVMKAKKLQYLQAMQNEVTRRQQNGDLRSEDAIMAELLAKSPSFHKWDNTFDFYMVELESNLPRKTLELFTVGLGDADRVYQNGFLLSEIGRAHV